MSEQEKRHLTALVREAKPLVDWRQTLKWTGVWFIGLVACGLLAVGLVVHRPGALAGVFAGIPAVAGLICLYALIAVIAGHVRWSRYHKDFTRRTVPQLQAALRAGRVDAKHVTARGVIEIAEVEDESPGYLFDVGDGNTLFLKGQRYVPAQTSDDGRWPNTDFEIVRSPTEHLWIGIFCSGEKLEPSAVIESTKCKDNVTWSEREELVQGTPESVLKTLLKAP
jgi:hypothetical protein